MSGEELYLGREVLEESDIEKMDLDDLYRFYEKTVLNVSDTRYLPGVYPQISAILRRGTTEAAEVLESYGIDISAPDAVYNPSLTGAHYNNGVLEVGEPGVCDRMYYLVTELSHEMLHHHLRDEHGVEEYTAREEGLLQVWNLHQDDVIGYETNDRLTATGDAFAEDEAERRLADMRDVYNESDEMPDGFGDDIHQYATWFLNMYDDYEGTRNEKMQHILDYGFRVLGEE